MSTYVVYHVASVQVLKEFNSESSAKRSATCANRNAFIDKNVTVAPYACSSYEDYQRMAEEKLR